MKSKNEVGHIIRMFLTLVRTQFDTMVKVIRSDNGAKYLEKGVKDYLTGLGIHHQTSCVYTQQNGIAERKNRHLLEVARAIMFSMHVPKYYWGETILTATYLINRMPSRVLSFNTPKSQLMSIYPNTRLMSTLPFKLFGCVVCVYIQSNMRTKLDKHTQRCIFMGYSSTQKGYKCYCPLTKRMYVSLDVVFDEQKPFYSTDSQIPVTGNHTDDYWSILDVITCDHGSNKTVSQPELAKGQEMQDTDGRTEGTLERVNLPITNVYTRRNKEVQEPGYMETELTDHGEGGTDGNKSSDLPIALRKRGKRLH